MENKALGKGLSALISQTHDKTKMAEEVKDYLKGMDHKLEGIMNLAPQLIEIEKIRFNSLQPRGKYDEAGLNELAASLKEKGILQPIMVRPAKDGYFEVVMGERRLRAAKIAGLKTLPALVKDVDDSETLLLALVENIQRQDLNVIDEAKAFDRLAQEFHLSQDQIAKAMGKDRTTVANTMRLLKLPAKIQHQIVQEQISMGHARALLALNDEEAQLKMATQIIQQSLSVRSVEGLVREVAKKTSNKTKVQKLKDPDIASLEDELRRILGTKVTVEDKKGKGKLIVEYYSLNDLDRILDQLRKSNPTTQ
jgi:ParB family chromosome partitioning protein